MAILKFRNKGEWESIAAFKGEDGKDGAIQYQAGPGINISDDNIISATFSGDGGVDITVDAQPLPDSNNPVASGGVYTALQDKANRSEIKTDTSELTNGAGFITSNDIPGDLGDFKNEAGFLTTESDPLFSKSAAASITAADKTLWNRIGDFKFVPLYFALNFNSATVNSFNHTYKVPDYYNKIIQLAGSLQKAIVCVVTAGHSVILHYYQTAHSSSKESITDYYGLTPSDAYGRYATVRLRIIQNQDTGAHISTQFSSLGSSYNLVTKNKVLTTDNTTSFTPTKDYHPATKKYVDEQVAAGVDGIGGIEVEADPIFMNSVASSITEDDITRWNNKADSGGIDQEIDPTVPAWVKAITEDDIASWNNKLDEMPDISGDINDAIDDALSGAGYISKEEDPLFVNSPAASITDEDKIKWDNKLDASNLYQKTTNTLEINTNNMTNDQISALIPFIKQFLYKTDTGITVRSSLLQSSISLIQRPSSTTYYRGSPCAFFDHLYTNKSYQVTDYIYSDDSQAILYGGKLGNYNSALVFVEFSLSPNSLINDADTSSVIGWQCRDRTHYSNAMSFLWHEYVLFFNLNNVTSDNPDTTDFALVRTKDQYCGFGS